MDAFDDIRNQLRRDHESALAELDALRTEADDPRCRFRLERVRRAWMIHALAEEAVVYRALEGAVVGPSTATRADERFVEHELVESVFDKIAASRPRSVEWKARVNVVRNLIARHVESEHTETFAQLAERFDTEELREMGNRFLRAREKLTLLEEAKAARVPLWRGRGDGFSPAPLGENRGERSVPEPRARDERVEALRIQTERPERPPAP